VSVCCSVRITPTAHEAGVETHREFRGHGYAAHVVSAWASTVRDIGPIPLYSTSWQNTASQRLPRAWAGAVRHRSAHHVSDSA